MNYPQWLETLIDKTYDDGIEDGSMGEPYLNDPRKDAAQAIQARFEQALGEDDEYHKLLKCPFCGQRQYSCTCGDNRNAVRAEARKRWSGENNESV